LNYASFRSPQLLIYPICLVLNHQFRYRFVAELNILLDRRLLTYAGCLTIYSMIRHVGDSYIECFRYDKYKTSQELKSTSNDPQNIFAPNMDLVHQFEDKLPSSYRLLLA